MKKAALLFTLILLNCKLIFSQDRLSGYNFATRSEVIAPHAMACTSHPLASQVAIDVLKKGGNAIDAAIAADACLGLMEPNFCGIGGDLFAIVWDAKTKQLYGLNASGRSPYSLTREYLIKQGITQIPSEGPLPVSVPGCVDGWFQLHDKFGSLPMEEILKPAIQYASEGFPVTEVIAWDMAISAPAREKFPNFSKTYMPAGRTPAKGEIFKNPDLARTLHEIATGGRDVFYKGDIARTIDKYMKENGGFLSYKDLADHQSEWVKPVSTNYRGYDVWELPPNGQGIAALEMLNILEQYDVKSMGFGSPEYMHLFTEAKKLAFEDRAKYYADPAFNKIPVDGLISKDYAKKRAALIDMNHAGKSYPAGMPGNGDTIYLTVADSSGNMVSLIQSNFQSLGSGMTPTGLGFVLQDRGQLFNLEEGNYNTYEPHKRPFHTIIPGFITKNGVPYMSFGVMGGDMQPQGQVQVIVNHIDFGMNLQEAGDAPRMQHMGSSTPTGLKMTDGGTLYLESGFKYESIRRLVMMGHHVAWDVGGYGGYEAIMWDPVNKVYYGASESRKDGQAEGY
jgi:gamma-glutamyltranspeptidase / glutathione hydrolase